MVAILAGVGEELFFRGLFRGACTVMGRLAGLVAASVLRIGALRHAGIRPPRDADGTVPRVARPCDGESCRSHYRTWRV